MRRRTCFCSIALLVVAIACERSHRDEQESRTAPAVEPAAPAAAAGSGQATEEVDTATPPSDVTDQPTGQPPGGAEPAATELPAAGDSSARPKTVAPSAEGDRTGMKNWLLIEFVRAIEPADLEWLEGNGFRVDTVLSATTVRGWLENAAGGAVIGKDPRISRIDAQMR